MPRRKDGHMKKSEIENLLAAKGWSGRRLAAELDVSENTVVRWLAGKTTPTGPAAILMRQWLGEARAVVEKPLAAAR